MQVLSPPELASEGETLGDLVSISFEIQGDTDDGNIFLRIYTKPQNNSGDVSWYRGTTFSGSYIACATLTLLLGSWMVLGTSMGLPSGDVFPSTTYTANMVDGADVEPVTNDNSGSFSTSNYSFSADDEIMAVSFQTDSSTGEYDFLIKSFTVAYTNRVQKLSLVEYVYVFILSFFLTFSIIVARVSWRL